MKYSVIVPVYNEAGNIEKLHEELVHTMSDFLEPYELIYVNDGSLDETNSILRQLHDVTIIELRRNYGQTAALSAGFAHAQGEVIITLDGDLQNDPKDIPKLIEKLSDTVDVVCGWRKIRHDTAQKRFVSYIARILRKVFINDGIHDAGCTLRVYKKKAVEGLGHGLYGEMHRFIPGILVWQGFVVDEVEVSHRPRVYGVTKYTWRRTAKGLVDMVIVLFWRKYATRPIHFFGILGILLSVFGTVILMVLFVLRLLHAVYLSDRIWPLVGILFVILGIQLFVAGMLADIMVRTYYAFPANKPYHIKEVIHV